ncbi:MAG: hypothetical protein ACTSU4_13130 [Promethearchaeota archaeon]
MIRPRFTFKHFIFFVALNIIINTDAGFLAPLISKIMNVFGVSLVEVSFFFIMNDINSCFIDSRVWIDGG